MNSSVEYVLRIGAYIAAIVSGLVVLGGFILAWSKHWLKPLHKLASTGNAFASSILPDVLDSFEKAKLAPEGTYKKWNNIIHEKYYMTESPKYLNEKGKKILKDSSISSIIDGRYDDLLEEMQKHDLSTALDVENVAFYILTRLKEDNDALKQVKNYIFRNPEIDLDTIIFVGSFHLRDKYFEGHPDILKTGG